METPQPAVAIALISAALLAAGCTGGGSEETPTPTSTATASPSATAPPIATASPTATASRTPTPTPPGTPTPSPSPSPTATPAPALPTPAPGEPRRAGLLLIDLASGEITTLYEGAGAGGRFEPSGQVVAGDSPTTFRAAPDGTILEVHDDRLRMTVAPGGRSRYYKTRRTEDAESRFVLEHDGVEVALDDPPAFGGDFSPSGDRLIGVVSFEPSASGLEVIKTYQVYDVATGEVLLRYESRGPEGTDSSEAPRWSPSGRYIADDGLGGLIVYDTSNRDALRLGTGTRPDGGSYPRWSPSEDALAVVSDDGKLAIVRLPGLEHVPIPRLDPSSSAWFDATGRYVVQIGARVGGGTLIHDTVTAEEVTAWRQRTVDGWFFGVYPVVATDAGPIAVLSGFTECGGFTLHHPALPGGSRCIQGQNPRLAPDAQSVAFVQLRSVLVFDVRTGQQRLLAEDLGPSLNEQISEPIARWNRQGTHILVQWPWFSLGWIE